MERTIDRFYADTYNEFFSLFNAYNEKLIGVLQCLLDFTPQLIFDLACGVGLSTLALRANFNGAEIVGVDIDSSLIALAEATMPHSNVKFHCCEISDLLAKTPHGTVDVIFVKSAYHYFERQIGLPQLQPLLKKNGAIVIAERTARSARSYPLPDIASSYWENIFVEPRPSRRLDPANSAGMSLSVSCCGEWVTVPTQLYIDVVRKNQLVGLWMLKPEVVSAWIENHLDREPNELNIFEEFWLYVYRNI